MIFAALSIISPISSLLTISGGVSASESPTARSIRPCSWKPRSMASKPRVPTASGRDARSMPAVRPMQRMSSTFGRPFSVMQASYQNGSIVFARSNNFSSR